MPLGPAFVLGRYLLNHRIPLVVPALQDATSSIAGIIHKKDFVQSSLCLVPVSSEVMERAVDNTLGTTALEVVVCLLLKKSRLQELFYWIIFLLSAQQVDCCIHFIIKMMSLCHGCGCIGFSLPQAK